MYRKIEVNSPSIMQSLDSITVLHPKKTSDVVNVDVCASSESRNNINLEEKQFESLNLTTKDDSQGSFLLIDNKEVLQISAADQFLSKLQIDDPNIKVKVISIFGNTGDGKSYTLNNTFFDKQEVFKTSESQSSCTLGVWAAYDHKLKVICLDTEGLLSSSNFELQTTRLLLKVLAVSDVIIYKTRAERLHRDMFFFLGSASRAFSFHFQSALKNVGLEGPLSALGPAVVIFHESKHTKPLQPSVNESCEDIIRSRFAELKIGLDAFSSVRYIGKQVQKHSDFSELKSVVKFELENTTVRSARRPSVIFDTLKVLNEKFSGDISASKPLLFPDQYFTCPDTCLSCGKRCENCIGHLKENIPHSSSYICKYQHQYNNFVYLCKRCHDNGAEQVVVPVSSTEASIYGLAKYMWSGYTIQCPTCGEIYTSRQYWYGNKSPEESMNVKSKIIHVWPGVSSSKGCQNTAQKVVDGVTYITETVASICSQPTKMLSSYVADQIAPKYWRPNDQIKHCHSCKKRFPPTTTKHHCRNCGEGFCETCSSHYMPVPKYGWKEPVRVCTNCFNGNKNAEGNISDSNSIGEIDIRARKYGEVVVNTLSTVANVLEYPKEFIKDSVRPSYWVPDDEITECCICKTQFGPALSLHHCRDCGRGVCDKCSPNKKAVPKRNWENPVRVCNACFKMIQIPSDTTDDAYSCQSRRNVWWTG